MRRIRIGLFIVLSLSALGLFVFALAPAIGGGPSRAAIPPQEQDPDLPTGAGDSIDKETYLALRNAWIMSRRGFDAKRDVDPLARERAIAQMGKQLNTLEALRKNRFAIGSATSSDRFSVAAAVSSTAWTPVGPAPLPQGQTSDVVNPVTGRIISIAIHPTNPDIVFVGTASGGLYRTLNGQAANPTWTPLMDTIQMQSNGLNALGTLAIGAIAIAPSNPDIVYIGTGEQNTGYFGSGLYRIDNATTATPTLVGPINPTADYGDGSLAAFNLRAISQILVHPTAPGTIFVSTSSGNLGRVGFNASRPPNSIPPLSTQGIYRSTNAAAATNSVTFTKLKINDAGGFASGDTDVSDMVLDPSDATANTLIAWVRSGNGADNTCTPGNSCAGIYRSSNAQGVGTFAQQLVSLMEIHEAS